MVARVLQAGPPFAGGLLFFLPESIGKRGAGPKAGAPGGYGRYTAAPFLAAAFSALAEVHLQ